MTLFKNLRDLLNAKSAEPKTCLCMVVSEQEGAEIWVEGKNTHQLTPHLVPIEKNKVVSLEIRLTGHEAHKAQVHSTHDLTYYYCNLKRVPFKLIPGGLSSNENHASASF